MIIAGISLGITEIGFTGIGFTGIIFSMALYFLGRVLPTSLEDCESQVSKLCIGLTGIDLYSCVGEKIGWPMDVSMIIPCEGEEIGWLMDVSMIIPISL